MVLKKNDTLPISFKANEWLGALGDIGVFVPIFMSLVALNGLPPARSLLFVGILYICSALYFRLPVPVQPLKAMAAIALTQSIPVSQLASGGFWIGFILLSLWVTGKIEWLSKFFTRPIVKGIQLGVGLMLIKASLKLVFFHTDYEYIFLSTNSFPVPGYWEFFSALWILALPQLPLTLGNAVFAVSDAANVYFGTNAKRAQAKNFAFSLGCSNIIISFFGGLPLCHGSGGLTAHYRFGARTCGATIIAGVMYVLLAVVSPAKLFSLFQLIPHWVLGLMLLYVGICHVLLLRELLEKKYIAAIIGTIGLATSNLGVALIFGLLVDALMKLWYGRKTTVYS